MNQPNRAAAYSILHRGIGIFVFLALATVAALSITAHIGASDLQGEQLTVTKTADTNDGTCNADCSLREAVAVATGASGGTIIRFDPTVFSSSQTITLTGGELVINSGIVTIDGPGANLLSVSGNDASRVFNIGSGGTVSLAGIKITRGKAPSSPNVGGGLYNNGGALTLTNVEVSSNSALFGAGLNTNGTATITNSAFNSNIGSVGLPEGGGILNNGEMTVTGSTFTGNAAIGGSAIRTTGSMTVRTSTFTSQGVGGVVYITGGVTRIENSQIGSDTGANAGAGIFNQGGSVFVLNTTLTRNSPGINNIGPMEVRNSLLRNNTGAGVVHSNGLMTVSDWAKPTLMRYRVLSLQTIAYGRRHPTGVCR